MSNIRRRSSSISSLNKPNQHRPISNLSTASKNIPPEKKKILNKPTWDATNSDLNQMKATQQELERRRLSHQSKNIDQVKTEFQKKQIKNLQQQSIKDPNVQLALLKEILFDGEGLKNFVKKNDNTLKAVQNFFNNDQADEDDNASIITNGNRRQVKINMTLAPNVKDLNDSTLPMPSDLANKNSKSKKSTISNVKINNINDLSFNQELDGDEENSSDQIPVQDENKRFRSDNVIDDKLKKFKLTNDLEKYKQLLEIKQRLLESSQPNQQSTKSVKKQTNEMSQLDTTELNLNDLEECLRILTSNKNNNTNKGKTTDNDLQDNNESVNLAASKPNKKLNSYELFENALTDLENKLIDFEKLTNKQSANYSVSKKNGANIQNTSTYTLTLIKIISNLIDHIKDTVVELNFEKLKNVETNKQIEIHRKLIDGLTNEVLSVKDQNKKLLNGFVNQQAKLEAEMDQIKFFFRNMSQLQNNQMQPHRLSSFQSQSSLDCSNNNQRHGAFQHQVLQPSSQQQQQQQPSMPRPVSCMSSLNEIKSADKFAERLNAMLLNDQINFSQSAQQLQTNLTNANNSSTSFDQFRSSFDNLNTINRSYSNLKMNDFNSQIQELSFKNVEAQQKLKQLQLEQKKLSLSNNEMQQTKINDSESQQREALEKLKNEQKMLKEQIGLLNKERQTAQHELDTLVSTNNSAANNTTAMSTTNKLNHEKNIQSAIMKHLNEINMNDNPNNNYDMLGTNTPSLSPIRPEKNV